MFKKIIHFLKYNNTTVLILAIIFLLGTGVFAQTEAGQAVIGSKQTSIQGIDNMLLLEADLENMDMDFKIEKIESDDKMYYVTYTYFCLVKSDNAWQYQIQEKIRKISKKLKQDLGAYLAEELGEEYDARIKYLEEEQKKAQEQGEEVRVEAVEYSGLIGGVLDAAGKVFPGYEPIKKYEIPSPTLPPTMIFASDDANQRNVSSAPDNLTDIYNNYIEENDSDKDNIFGENDNCPMIYNPEQLDSDNDGIGDECDLTPNGDEEETEIAATTTPEIIATTTPEAVCDIDNLDLCGNESDCNNIGGYWYDGQCNMEEYVIEEGVIIVDCSADYLDLCDEIGCGSLAGDYAWESEHCIASTTLGQ